MGPPGDRSSQLDSLRTTRGMPSESWRTQVPDVPLSSGSWVLAGMQLLSTRRVSSTVPKPWFRTRRGRPGARFRVASRRTPDRLSERCRLSVTGGPSEGRSRTLNSPSETEVEASGWNRRTRRRNDLPVLMDAEVQPGHSGACKVFAPVVGGRIPTQERNVHEKIRPNRNDRESPVSQGIRHGG